MSLSSWNFTIQDNSPVVTYAPFADGGLASGWQPWYSKSGFLKTPGEGGDGDSYHISSHPNASFSLLFHGTGVNLYGTTNTSYAVFIDGQEQKVAAVADDLVFQKADLTDGAHSLTLSVNPAKATEQFAFDRAVVFSPVKTLPTPAFYDNSDSGLTYSGTWKSVNAPGIPNATVTHDFQQTRTSGSSVSMTFSGAVGVAINGPVLWGDWVHSVDLDGTKTKYNASTFWKVPDALRFFQAGLDPNSSHTITLANPSDQMTLSLNSFTLFKVPGAADVAQSASGSAASKSSSGSATSKSSSGSATSKSSSASTTVGSSGSAGGSTAPTDSAAGSTSASDAAPSTTGTGGAAKAGAYCLTIASVLACSAFLLI